MYREKIYKKGMSANKSHQLFWLHSVIEYNLGKVIKSIVVNNLIDYISINKRYSIKM